MTKDVNFLQNACARCSVGYPCEWYKGFIQEFNFWTNLYIYHCDTISFYIPSYYTPEQNLSSDNIDLMKYHTVIVKGKNDLM